MKRVVLCLLTLSFLNFSSCETDAQEELLNNTETSLDSEDLSAKTGPWRRVFTDNFNANGNLNKWEKTNRADYNSRICKYKSGNPRIATLDRKSSLQLSARKSGSEYHSGHVKSRFKFKPKRGEEFRITSSIKLLAKQVNTYKGFAQTYGAWPAFWTVQEQNWPTKGEIDIMEGYSFGNNARFASNMFYGTRTNQNLLGHSAERRFNLGEGWHTYQQYWRHNNQGYISVRIVVDGREVARYDNRTNRNLRLQNFGEHNIIFNLNVGSDTGIFNNSRINLFSKTFMYVDYVRVDKRTL